MKSGERSYVQDPSDNYEELLDLPRGMVIDWVKRPGAGLGFVHAFVRSKSSLAKTVTRFRKLIAPDGMLWISWPKKSSGVATDVTEDVVREIVLPLGLVDIKVCAVDDTWSGLKLMIRKELRG